jgi:hypothetical protein
VVAVPAFSAAPPSPPPGANPIVAENARYRTIIYDERNWPVLLVVGRNLYRLVWLERNAISEVELKQNANIRPMFHPLAIVLGLLMIGRTPIGAKVRALRRLIKDRGAALASSLGF